MPHTSIVLKRIQSFTGKSRIAGPACISARYQLPIYSAWRAMMPKIYSRVAPRVLSFAGWLLAALLAANAADAAQVVLSWAPNSEPDVAGYRIHYGTTSQKYAVTVDVGNVTSCVVSGLSVGKTYYFAASAYDTESLESLLSKELTVKIDNESSICACDLTDDGTCNILDWSKFMADWGRTDCDDSAVQCTCDINEDNSCNSLDYSLFISDWGNTDCENAPTAKASD